LKRKQIYQENEKSLRWIEPSEPASQVSRKEFIVFSEITADVNRPDIDKYVY